MKQACPCYRRCTVHESQTLFQLSQGGKQKEQVTEQARPLLNVDVFNNTETRKEVVGGILENVLENVRGQEESATVAVAQTKQHAS